MGFLDRVKQKAEEYDVLGKAERAAAEIEKASQQAVGKAGELAHENRDKVSAGLDKAGQAIDSRTEGKYADKVAKAKGAVAKGVDKVAEQRPRPSAGGPMAKPDPAAPTPPTPVKESADPVDAPTPVDAPVPLDSPAPPTWGPPDPPADGHGQV